MKYNTQIYDKHDTWLTYTKSTKKSAVKVRYIKAWANGRTTSLYNLCKTSHISKTAVNRVVSSRLGIASISFWSQSDRWPYSAITVDQK